MDLFEGKNQTSSKTHEPLAVRMRPKRLSEFAGQEHILGEGKLLRRAIESDNFSSIILYGPPGTGKTTLAFVISNETKSYFEPLNAVTSNVAELRKVIEQSKKRFELKKQKTILFIDEIHRFNKAQQDVLMPDVEKGNPVLVGATTENPFFSIVAPLLSRSLVFELKPLSEQGILILLKRALTDVPEGLAAYRVKADEEALLFLAKISEGDARRALSALELAVKTTKPQADGVHLTRGIVEESVQKKSVLYDTHGDQHYDTISAFIKSMRASDADSAVYYLAKMIYAGEDPRFIARRMTIFASEDVGNADPQALMVAVSAFQALEFVGLPEARIILSQAVLYLSKAPKSKEAYEQIESALKDVETNRVRTIPETLKNLKFRFKTP